MLRYSAGAIALHWILALALAFQLALGFVIRPDPAGFALYQLHKSVGIAILLLTVVRIIWRLMHKPPQPVEGGWQHSLAHAVHIGFYLFLIFTPLSGWAVVSSASVKVPTLLFGTVPWPHLPLSGAWESISEDVHEWLSWFGIALFVAHVAGALRHHFQLRDGLLSRMAPGGSAPVAMGLAGLVLALGAITYFVNDRSGEPRGGGAAVQDEAIVAADTDATLAVADTGADSAAEDAAAAELAAAEALALEQEAAAEEAPAGPPPRWTIQQGGRLGFSVDNGDGGIRGSFSSWTGNITFDPDRPESADMRIEIDLTSVSVGDATQDDMLKGDEFFDTGSASKAVWQSRSVRANGNGRYTAQGTLSLKAASKPQTVNFTLSGEGLRRKVEGSATIDRKAFNVGGASAEAIAPNVAVTFRFDAVGRQP